MWKTAFGRRVLSAREWAAFAAGLSAVRRRVEDELAGGGVWETGVAAFDALTAGQKLALLARVGAAVRDAAAPAPPLTAATEGAVAAVIAAVRDECRDAPAGVPAADLLDARLLHDLDYLLADQFLDLPPPVARRHMAALGIDRRYFRHTPPDPTGRGLADARRTLAGLLGGA